ncbi:MAG: glutaredoxin family protein [Prochlorococcaceae cyanobacterium]|jgi:hypothetical protein
MAELILYTRRGCCLCEGLEERLRALEPPPPLRCLDVDGDPALLARYDLQVPVLAVEIQGVLRELPRVSPRLAGPRLRNWLQENGFPLQDA